MKKKPPADWPQEDNGAFICSASRPMLQEYKHSVLWLHEEARALATCEHGCCIRWECKSCGTIFDTHGDWEEDDSAGASTIN